MLCTVCVTVLHTTAYVYKVICCICKFCFLSYGVEKEVAQLARYLHVKEVQSKDHQEWPRSEDGEEVEIHGCYELPGQICG